jgi:hypothetical protein
MPTWNETLQSPVNYSVGTAASRAGSYAKGYQIINRSLTFAIWASSDPSVAVGGGTPIYPGTSVTWQQDGDLWLIAEGPNTAVTISYDVSSWQPNPIAVATAILNSGVIIVDNPVLLANRISTTQTYDISRYQSVFIQVERAGGNSNTYAQVQIGFDYPGGLGGSTPLFSRVIELPPTGVNAQPVLYSAVFPCVGSTLKLTIVGPIQVIAIASNRPTSSDMQQQVTNFNMASAGVGPSSYLHEAEPNGGPVAAGNTYYYVPPWHGLIKITLVVVITAGQTAPILTVASWDPNAGGAWYERTQTTGTQVIAALQTYVAIMDFPMVGSMIRASIANLNPGAFTNGWLTVTPIRNGL